MAEFNICIFLRIKIMLSTNTSKDLYISFKGRRNVPGGWHIKKCPRRLNIECYVNIDAAKVRQMPLIRRHGDRGSENTNPGCILLDAYRSHQNWWIPPLWAINSL